jgi:4-hydroxy-3-methylbut-2-enyl diphosphate reductase IspH
VPVTHVQSAADLDPAWFRPYRVVGLTAGTSTLEETIDEVERALRRLPVAPASLEFAEAIQPPAGGRRPARVSD